MPNIQNTSDFPGAISLYSALFGSLLLGIAMGIRTKSILVGVFVACGVFCSLFSIVNYLECVVDRIEAALDEKLAKPSKS